MKQQYRPKRLAPASVPPPSCGGAEALGPCYSLFILPEGVTAVTDGDLERFPPVPLGDEETARAFLTRALEGDPAPGKKGRGLLGDVLYYLALAALILGIFLFRGASDGAPVTFAGFSAMRVLTASMQDEIPQGSLIITRHVDPNTLEIGDDITYMISQDTTITHRIINITEHYGETGKRAFTTQGVMNPDPDSLLVPADNVVGKVVFHNLALGQALTFVRAHWTWLAVLLGLCLAFLECLRVLARESRGDGEKRLRPEAAGAYKK